MSSIEMNDALIRSSRFTDQLSEYEYIKVFARIRSENEFVSNGESRKGDKLSESEAERKFFSTKDNLQEIVECRRSIENSRAGSPREISSPKTSKILSTKYSNPHGRPFSPTSSKVSSLSRNNTNSPKHATPDKKRSNSVCNNSSRVVISSKTHTAEKSCKKRSSFNDSSPKRPTLSISTKKEHSIQEKVGLVSPIKPRVENSSSIVSSNTLSKECEASKLCRCVTVQDDKTIHLLPAMRCSCEACSNKLSNSTNNRSTTIELSPRGNQKIFNFEKVFRESSSQEEVYIDAIQNNVSTLFQGINSTVITYGAPGSGKTFTLQGTKAMPGVIPRSLRDIFAYIANAKGDCDRKDFKVDISFVELLQSNQFRNVLKEPSSTDVRSRTPSCHPDSNSDTDFSTWTAAAKRVSVNSADEAMAAIEDTMKAVKRRTAKSDEVSSRGHLICTVYVCTTISCSENIYIPKDETFESFLNTCGDESEKITEILQGRLHFVELASTDRVSTTKVQRLKFIREDSSNAETHHINLSLLAFGEVLTRLSINSVTELKIYQQRMIESCGAIKVLRNEDFLQSAPEVDDKKTNFDFDGLQGLNPLAVRFDMPGQSSRSPKNSASKLNASAVLTPGHGNGENNSSVGDSALRMLHVPYMDSKLTLLLRDSLGGNSRTVMITTIDPCIESYSQTLYSLNLAMKASKVLNRPTSNWSKVADKSIESPPRRKENRTVAHLKASFLDTNLDTQLSAISHTPSNKIKKQPMGLDLQVPVLRLKTYKVTLDQLQLMNMEAGKSKKVFPLCSSMKIGILESRFQTTRQCQINSVTSFSETFQFEVNDKSMRSGSVISLGVVVDGFDEPDHASGVLVLNKKLFKSNYNVESNSAVILLTTKLSWTNELGIHVSIENRPSMSCRATVTEDMSNQSSSTDEGVIEKYLSSKFSPQAHTPRQRKLVQKNPGTDTVKKDGLVQSMIRKTQSPMQVGTNDVLSVRINSVSVSRLSCIEQLGRKLRHQNMLSQNIFFVLQFGNFWKSWSQEYSLSASRLSTSCQWDNLDLSFYPTRGVLRNFCIQLSVFSRETEPSKGSVDSLLGIAYIPLSSNVTSTAPLHEVPCTTLEHPSRENTERVTINYEIKVASDEKWFSGKILDCKYVNRFDFENMTMPIIRDTYDILYDDCTVEQNVPSDLIRRVHTAEIVFQEGYQPLVAGDAVLVKSLFKVEQEMVRVVDSEKKEHEILGKSINDCKRIIADMKQSNASIVVNLQSAKEKINELEKAVAMTKAKLLEEARGRARAHELAAALSKAKAKIEVDLQRMPSDDPFETMEISLAEKSRLEGERQAHQMKSKRGELEQELAKLTAARDRAEGTFQKVEITGSLREQLRCIEAVLDFTKKEKTVMSSMLEHAIEETKLLVAAKSKAEVEAREREDVKAKEARKKLALQLLDGDLSSTPIRAQHRNLNEALTKLKAEADTEMLKYSEVKDKLSCIRSDAQVIVNTSTTIEKQMKDIQEHDSKNRSKMSSISFDSPMKMSYDGLTTSQDPFNIYDDKDFYVYMDEVEAEMFGMTNPSPKNSSATGGSNVAAYLDNIYREKKRDTVRTFYYKNYTHSTSMDSIAQSGSIAAISMEPLAPIEGSQSMCSHSQSTDDSSQLQPDRSPVLSPYGPNERAKLLSLSTASKTLRDGGQADERLRCATTKREAVEKNMSPMIIAREKAESALNLAIQCGLLSDLHKAVDFVIETTTVEIEQLKDVSRTVEEEIEAIRCATKVTEEVLHYVAKGVVRYIMKALVSKASTFMRQKEALLEKKKLLNEEWIVFLESKEAYSRTTPIVLPSDFTLDCEVGIIDEIINSEPYSFDTNDIKVKLKEITSQEKPYMQQQVIKAMVVSCKRSIFQLQSVAYRLEHEIVDREKIIDDVKSCREEEEQRLEEFATARETEEAIAKAAIADGDVIEQVRALCSAYTSHGREFACLSKADLLTIEETKLLSSMQTLFSDVKTCSAEENTRRKGLITLTASLAHYPEMRAPPSSLRSSSSHDYTLSVSKSSSSCRQSTSRKSLVPEYAEKPAALHDQKVKKSVSLESTKGRDKGVKLISKKEQQGPLSLLSSSSCGSTGTRKEQPGLLASSLTSTSSGADGIRPASRRRRTSNGSNGKKSFGSTIALSRSDSGKCIPRKQNTFSSAFSSSSSSSSTIENRIKKKELLVDAAVGSLEEQVPETVGIQLSLDAETLSTLPSVELASLSAVEAPIIEVASTEVAVVERVAPVRRLSKVTERYLSRIAIASNERESNNFKAMSPIGKGKVANTALSGVDVEATCPTPLSSTSNKAGSLATKKKPDLVPPTDVEDDKNKENSPNQSSSISPSSSFTFPKRTAPIEKILLPKKSFEIHLRSASAENNRVGPLNSWPRQYMPAMDAESFMPTFSLTLSPSSPIVKKALSHELSIMETHIKGSKELWNELSPLSI